MGKDSSSLSAQETKMARKSRELRLSQSRELFAAYTEADLADDFRYSFIRDMISRLERNRGTSTKQRNWIDSLIEEGVPAPKGDPVLLARIETAQAVVGMKEYDTNILGEFAGKIRRGWDLSEKQAAWMEKLLAEADRLVVDGPYTPDEETIEKLKLCVALAPSYSGVYWDTHGGTRKAMLAVKEYLENGAALDEWPVNKLLKSMAGKLRELLETPYVTPEKPCYVVEGLNPETRRNVWGLGAVMGAPSVSERGVIVYPVLTATGSLVMADRNTLAKRKPRN
jgi:hypothetical protein